jgi:hypothetical protein
MRGMAGSMARRRGRGPVRVLVSRSAWWQWTGEDGTWRKVVEVKGEKP